MLHTVLSSHMLMWVQSQNGGAHSSLQDYASLPLLVGLHVVHLFHKQEVTAQKEKKKNNETHVHELFFQYVIENYSLFPLQIGIRVRRVLIPFVDRKSTRLNSSHVAISYAVFCFNKKSNRD